MRVSTVKPEIKDGKRVTTKVEGEFLEWGTSFEEFDNGAVQITVGIVKLDDGQVITPVPESIKFLEVSKVYTKDDGLKNISSLVSGDSVLTTDGYKKILTTDGYKKQLPEKLKSEGLNDTIEKQKKLEREADKKRSYTPFLYTVNKEYESVNEIEILAKAFWAHDGIFCELMILTMKDKTKIPQVVTDLLDKFDTEKNGNRDKAIGIYERLNGIKKNNS